MLISAFGSCISAFGSCLENSCYEKRPHQSLALRKRLKGPDGAECDLVIQASTGSLCREKDFLTPASYIQSSIQEDLPFTRECVSYLPVAIVFPSRSLCGPYNALANSIPSDPACGALLAFCTQRPNWEILLCTDQPSVFIYAMLSNARSRNLLHNHPVGVILNDQGRRPLSFATCL